MEREQDIQTKTKQLTRRGGLQFSALLFAAGSIRQVHKGDY